jgi:phosphate/sulfate permease
VLSSPASCSAIAWAPGYWPGQSGFNDIIAVLYIITILAFVSAIFLIAATMSALIAEQAREIAVLKVLGGRRRQIGGITARTAGLLGLAAAVAGGYGSGRLDRAAARSGLLRGSLIPDTMRMGLRQKRRSIAVIAQVAVAAGLAISFLALGQSITAVIGQTIRKLHVSIDVSGQRAAAHGRSAARHSPLPPPRRASPAPSQWRQAPCSTTTRPTPCGASAPVRSMPIG